MPEYQCLHCGFFTNLKSNFLRHLATKKHIKNLEDEIDHESGCIPKKSKHSKHLKPSQSDMLMVKGHEYICQYCNKIYKHKSSFYKHMNHRCKKNEEIQMQKLADLMNKINKDDPQIEGVKNYIKKEISKLSKELNIQNINYGNHVNGQQINNIQILNYNKTDYDFLTDKDFIKCIEDNNHCVKKLIETVHFNKKKPENMNIYISSIKGKFIMVYRDNSWQIKDRKKQIDDLYETNEFELEQWYDEYNEKYPDIIKSFRRYLKNKAEDDTLIQNIKHEIEMMLYNKRGLIQE